MTPSARFDRLEEVLVVRGELRGPVAFTESVRVKALWTAGALLAALAPPVGPRPRLAPAQARIVRSVPARGRVLRPDGRRDPRHARGRGGGLGPGHPLRRDASPGSRGSPSSWSASASASRAAASCSSGPAARACSCCSRRPSLDAAPVRAPRPRLRASGPTSSLSVRALLARATVNAARGRGALRGPRAARPAAGDPACEDLRGSARRPGAPRGAAVPRGRRLVALLAGVLLVPAGAARAPLPRPRREQPRPRRADRRAARAAPRPQAAGSSWRTGPRSTWC